jgi:hypothetical protein
MKSTQGNEAIVIDPELGLEQVRIIKQAKINVSAAGDNPAVAAVAHRRIRLTAQSLSVASDVTVAWMSGTGVGATEVVPPRTFKSGGGIDGNWGPQGYYGHTEIGEPLTINLGGAVQVSGVINYIEE